MTPSCTCGTSSGDVLNFLLSQVEPMKYMDLYNNRLLDGSIRSTTFLISKTTKLAEDLGFPFKMLDRKIYIKFFDDLKFVTDEQWKDFVDRCFDKYFQVTKPLCKN